MFFIIFQVDFRTLKYFIFDLIHSNKKNIKYTILKKKKSFSEEVSISELVATLDKILE